jgi:hypothetical protein
MKSLSMLLLSLLFALTGCGDPVVDPGYRGEALLTVQGQLRATQDYESKGPLHVALVWFPKALMESDENTTVDEAFAMVTEDVPVQGSFPLDYRFDLFQPPPPEALGPWGEGVPGKGAMGLVVAYEDLNGNGKLDRIPRDGTPKDRIVGSSFHEFSGQYMVIYSDRAHPGIEPGFNLVATDAQGAPVNVSPSTKLPLTLTRGGDEYDTLVCEGGWFTYVFMPVCGLGDGDEPASLISAWGDITLKGRNLVVDIRLTYDGGDPVYDAEVTLGGRPIPFDPSRQGYYLIEDDSTLVTPGTAVELMASARGEQTRRTIQVPQPFSITAPTEGAQVSSAASFTVRWAAAVGALDYTVELDAPFSFTGEPSPDSALAHVFNVPGGYGEAVVRVGARGGSSGGFDFFPLNLTVLQERRFTLVP